MMRIEYGFFHPDRGYWQTRGDQLGDAPYDRKIEHEDGTVEVIRVDPMEQRLARYPAGTVNVPLRPSADHQWQGGAWVYVAPVPPTAAELETQVQAMADRITAGSDRDKAFALVLADMLALIQGITVAEARPLVRDRFVKHLRNLKGL